MTSKRKTRYRRTTDSVAADLGQGKLAVMGLARGRYYSLNPAARLIWDFLDAARSRREIHEHLQTHFDVDDKTCERDIDAFLKDMLHEGLAETVIE